jgi:hypothetical protein
MANGYFDPPQTNTSQSGQTKRSEVLIRNLHPLSMVGVLL